MGENTLYFPTFNRNKDSVAVDFRNPKAVELLTPLIQQADVLMENFRPGTMEKMGLSPEVLKGINPNLVIVSISGFGQSGPFRDRPAFDWIVQAMGGIMSTTGTEESGPILAGLPICDHLTSVYAALAVVSALYNRKTTQKGQYIDVSLLDSVVSVQSTYIPDYGTCNHIQGPVGTSDPLSAPVGRYKTLDGYVYIHAGSAPLYRRLTAFLKNPVLSEERFQDSLVRHANHKLLDAEMEAWTSTKTSEEVDNILCEVGIPCGIVSNMKDVYHSAHLKARKSLIELEVEGVGQVTYPGPAIKFVDQPEPQFRRAPRLGEHTEKIFGDLCGFTPEQLEAFKREGVI